jgi:hypothetical protein
MLLTNLGAKIQLFFVTPSHLPPKVYNKEAVKCLQLPSHHLAAPFVRFKLIGLTLLIDKYVAAKIQQISASCNRGLDVDTFYRHKQLTIS